jgi:hypothetical protein
MKKTTKKDGLQIRMESAKLLGLLEERTEGIELPAQNKEAGKRLLEIADDLSMIVASLKKAGAELKRTPGDLDDDMRKRGRFPTMLNGRKRYVSVPQD